MPSVNPKSSLSSPEKKRRPTIGFLNNALGHQVHNQQWLGSIDAARRHDANLILFSGNALRDPSGFDAQANALYDLIGKGALDGLVINSAALNAYITPQEMEAFINRFRPLPMASLEVVLEGIPSIMMDNFGAMREMMVHLIEAHHYRRIAFIRGPENHSGAQERYRAYTETLAEYGIPFDPNLVSPSENSWLGETAIRFFLDEHKLLPRIDIEAVAAVSDGPALQAIKIFQARGIRVPEDIAMVGFDDFAASSAFTPPVTSVRPPFYEMGGLAVEMVLAQLHGEKVPAQANAPIKIVVRQSCGCSSLAAAQSAARPEIITAEAEKHGDSKSFKIWLKKQRQGLIADLAETMDNVEAAPGWAARLLDGLDAELNGGVPGGFLDELNHVLRQAITAGSDLAAWQNTISVLRGRILPALAGNLESILRADDLWQPARVIIGEIAQRAQAYQKIQAGQQADTLRSISQALITSFDVQILMDVLARELPRVGIPSAYLSIYEDAKIPEKWARLFLACNEQGRIPLEPDGRRFPSTQLIPEALWPQERRYDYVVEPLYFREDQIGFALFEAGPREGNVYDVLRGEISSALQGATLVQHVANRALQLQTASEVSRTTSSVIDLGELIQQAVNLVHDRFNLYYVGLFLLDEERSYAVLQAGTGEAGRELLKNGHKLAASSESMIGWCIANQQARIALDVGVEAERFSNPLLPATRSELALPLISRGQVIGAMTVQSDKESAFSQEDITTLQTMADQLANAIENARLFEQTQLRAAELTKAKESAEVAKDEAERARGEAEREKQVAEIAKEEAEKARRAAEEASQSLALQMWQTTGQALLNQRMRGEQDLPTLSNNVIQQVCQYLDAHVGILYIAEENLLQLTGTYAYTRQKKPVEQLQLGESLAGQAALEKRLIAERIPDDYFTEMFETTGELLAKNILAAPFVYEKQLIGVVQIETFAELNPAQLEFLNNALESMAITFMTARARARVNELYAKTRQQADELQSQEEELRATNEELEAQAENLRASESRLRDNQTALEAANVDLEEKTHTLQEKQAILDHQNQVLRDARQELERKAEELTVSNKYKSEFLANMSHELRTPLNSLLILSRMLANNEGGNLTPDQVESARIIAASGGDLLGLINEILDLSKVEAGRMSFNFAPMRLENLAQSMRSQFEHVAEQKNLQFEISLGARLPESITTDQQRVEQVIKNLLSNAFKFTEKGMVQLVIEPEGEMIAIRVRDSGIGMTPEQQQRVFEAFQQADGSTSRKYGGTGLGLTISCELSNKLGGRIGLESEFGKGSVFTLYLPIQRPEVEATPAPTPASVPATAAVEPSAPSTRKVSAKPKPANDDRDKIQKGNRVLLVIEDDAKFAKVLFDYAHKKDFGSSIESVQEW